MSAEHHDGPFDPAAMALGCPCVRRHSPPALVVELHHVEPRSWGGEDIPANKTPVCVQTHYSVHALLDRYVHHGGTPPRPEVELFTPHARLLAAQGWAAHLANHPDHPTPYGP